MSEPDQSEAENITPCNCIEEINAKLAEVGSNTKLEVPFMLNPNAVPRVMIRTERADSKIRRGPSNVFATYCPFCGRKYVDKSNG